MADKQICKRCGLPVGDVEQALLVGYCYRGQFDADCWPDLAEAADYECAQTAIECLDRQPAPGDGDGNQGEG